MVSREKTVMRRLSIGLRLTLWYLVFFAVAQLAFGAGMWLILRDNLYDLVDDRLILLQGVAAGETNGEMFVQFLPLRRGKLSGSRCGTELEELVMGFGSRQGPGSSEKYGVLSYC